MAIDLSELPFKMKHLPLDTRGYPVPWFVDKKAPYINGNPDFRVMDGKHLVKAVREKRCWVCGLRLMYDPGTFVSGPMCGINRTSAEPPSHYECAVFSAKMCPFLSQPKRIRDDRDLPEDKMMAGVGIMRNPGVVMLWSCPGYTIFAPGGHSSQGVLFTMHEPTKVEWLARGRAATRDEVVESIDTGIPILLEQAAKEGAEACYVLGMMAGDFMNRWLPEGASSEDGNI